MSIEVFHGSNVEVCKPLAAIGRENLDFGRAFYVTDIREQAEHWGEIVYSRRETGSPIVSKYMFDYDAVKHCSYKRLVFRSYNKAWLDFVVSNRRGGEEWKQYDIVEGGVANDQVIETVNLYMDEIITARQAIGRLKYCKPNNQIAIINQDIIDKFLVFQESYENRTYMRDYILHRKIANVIAIIAERRGVTQPEALLMFYTSKVGEMIHNPQTGMYLMSDNYIADEFILYETELIK